MQFTFYSSELMRHSVGNNDHFAFGDLMFFAAFDFGATDFVRRDFLCIDSFSAGHQRGRPIDDVNNVCVERVDLRLTGFDAATGVHLVTGGFEQGHALGKCRRNGLGVDESCSCSRGR